ncbi:MAG: DUF1015 domain-containing protein [Bacteroidetes bacterium]|nr:DUF1015 domain-containing protein [Bacteroidota bacterium]
MITLKPFAALRPQTALAAAVAARPYDVLNSLEAVEEAQGNPHSFLHVTKAEIDLPAGTDLHSQVVYDKAKENLDAMIRKEVLFQEAKTCYYLYELVMKGRSQTGLVALSSVADYHNDLIKKHEFTRPQKEKDRIDHMRTVRAQTGNVFLAYRERKEMDQLVADWKNTHSPIYDFTASDEIEHRIWVVDRRETVDQITQLFLENVPATYIADGHHRAASAAKVAAALPDSDAAKFFLTTLFPADQLAILDYNRVVKDLNGQTEDELLSALQGDFQISKENEPVRPGQLHEFGMYLNKNWYRLRARSGTWTEDPIGVLDVSLLSDRVLNKQLGVQDQRTDTRIDFVGGIRGLGELMRRVDSGEMAIAFSLYPVSIHQLFDIADSGSVMPPKSTWFEPKLRDGLLTHLI